MNRRLEARAKALIVLEEMQSATRPKVGGRSQSCGNSSGQCVWMRALNARCGISSRINNELIISVGPATHDQVRFSIRSRVGLGDVWKVVGSCPELGRGRPEVRLIV